MPDDQDPDDQESTPLENDEPIDPLDVVAATLVATGQPLESASLEQLVVPPDALPKVIDLYEMWQNRHADRALFNCDQLAQTCQAHATDVEALQDPHARALEFAKNAPNYSSQDEYGKNIKKKFEEDADTKQQRERGKSMMGAFMHGP